MEVTTTKLPLIGEKAPSFETQTTKGKEGFTSIIKAIEERIRETGKKTKFTINDTLCGAVSNRAPQLREFSKKHDIILFVSGTKSSNGKYLYSICKENNPNSYFISTPEELNPEWINKEVNAVGICGATSTPMWLMKEVAKAVEKLKP